MNPRSYARVLLPPFFFVLTQVPLPNLPILGLCDTLQLYILAIVQRKRKGNKEISLKHSIITILRNTKGADKDNKDHRMSSYHEFLNNKGTQTKFMIKKNKKIKK